MKDSKALGLDGFNALLKKRAWNIMESLVCVAVKSFFRLGRILRKMNVTAISLIPKVQGPLNSPKQVKPRGIFDMMPYFLAGSKLILIDYS
jgi:hypothetical protein